MLPPHKLDLVHLAIRSGIFGHIQWNDSAVRLVQNNPALGHLSSSGIRALLRQFVIDGHALDVRCESRAEYQADPYWYRAIIPVAGLTHGLFVEIRLIEDDPVEPWVEIVSAHEQIV